MPSRIVNARAFRASYGLALAAFLARHDEPQLRAAYELGRDAVAGELSMLDLAVAHHDGLAEALASADDPRAVALAAGDFFLEALSAYEMVQRGFREVHEAAALERRQADLLRQLSNFLADASLALGASDSLEEMLQLVAEQARELVGAEACLVRLDLEGGGRIEAVSEAEPDTWSRLLETQMTGAVGDAPRQADGERRTLNELLTTLDGRPIGSIRVSSVEFSELDAVVLVQLAQMASAAVERRRLYRNA
jgi:Phosphoserine phosphatase RsbU, N-terminal domain